MKKKCVFCHFYTKKHDFCTYIWENYSTFAPDMRNLPIVTKSLLLANLVFWLLDMVLVKYGIQLNQILGLHYITADGFHWWQPITYMFMHANFSHLFFNMFAVRTGSRARMGHKEVHLLLPPLRNWCRCSARTRLDVAHRPSHDHL